MENPTPINIIIDADYNIKKLIKKYFIKINRLDLINNWQKKYHFLYNGKKLSGVLDSKVKDIMTNFAKVEVL